jgi:hypothetical protein
MRLIGIGIGLDLGWNGCDVSLGSDFCWGEGVGIWLGVCCVCERSHVCWENTFLFLSGTQFVEHLINLGGHANTSGVADIHKVTTTCTHQVL